MNRAADPSAAAQPGKTASQPWRDHLWWSADGLRLHARVYGENSAGLPILCLPGLTRNARDFEVLAPLLAQTNPVYALNLRGRGESAYAKDSLTYVPLTYAQDVAAMLDAAGIDRFISIGTSLGGIVTMLLAAMLPGRLAGAVFNDVGPEIDATGLARIRTYVGQSGSEPTWVHAARSAADTHGVAYPDWQIDDWLRFVKRTHRVTPEGRIVADYDPNIAQPFRVPGGESGGDLWPAFAALKTVPTLIVRGGESDILAASTAQMMLDRLDSGTLITIPGTGHAPTLDEPAAQTAITALVARAAG